MLKFTYENESDVPEAHKALYKQSDIELTTGKKTKLWVLDVADVVPKSRFVEFRDNNIRLTDEIKAVKEQFDGIDNPERARDLLRISKDIEMADAEKFLKKGGVDAIVNERTKAMKEDFDRKLSEATSRASKAQADLDRYKIDTAVLTVASRMPLHEGADGFILQEARNVFKVVNGEVVAVGPDGKELYSANDATSKLGVEEWMNGLPKKHAFLFKESTGAGSAGGGGSGGGGGAGNNGVNPWKKETWNKTQQQEIYKKDAAMASRLAKAAGVGMFSPTPVG